VGLYSGEWFFGLIDDDTLFFKTDASNGADYRTRNMPRFMAPADRPPSEKGYHQVPADIIEDAESLTAWARKAVAVARASPAKRKPRPAGRQTRD
jgi:TfoX/Sxy family transcriptional regulator of competence genes